MDNFQLITNHIIQTIEANPGNVTMPWHRMAVMPFNATTQRSYSGGNALWLWVRGQYNGYSTPRWATYRQWQSIGGQVKKGEKGAPVMFFTEREKEGGSGEKERYKVVRWSTVFNLEQVEGVEFPELEGAAIVPVSAAEEFITRTGADIRVTGGSACYMPGVDRIEMPEHHLWKDGDDDARTQAWYAVLFHELTHWTGAKHRLDRLGERHDKKAYAFEELIAEFGAAFLCARVGITNEPRVDHAQYIAHWVKLLKDDSRALFRAASKAQAAVNFLEGLQVQEAAA